MTKRKISHRVFALILSCAFPLAASSAWANHRSGYFPLPEVIAVGDFNEDGNLDMAVVNTGYSDVAIFLGDGKGGFKLEGILPADTLARDIHTADLNGDGHLDLVVTNEWGYNISVYLGDGQGGFSPARTVQAAGAEPHGFAIGDFNEDGHPDLAVGFQAPSTFAYYQGDGNGQFTTPPTTYPQAGLGPEYLTAVDLNKDNHLDIASAVLPQSLSVLLGNGDGTFTQLPVQATNNLPASVGAGDFNNDGNVDLVVNGGEPHNLDGLFLDPFLGDGLGNFTAQPPILGGLGYSQGPMGIGDFRENGKLDIAVGVVSGIFPLLTNNQILLYFGNGNGTFNKPNPVTVGTEPFGVFVVDVNKDGHQDLLVTNRTDGTVSVLLGDGRGRFKTSATVSTLFP